MFELLHHHVISDVQSTTKICQGSLEEVFERTDVAGVKDELRKWAGEPISRSRSSRTRSAASTVAALSWTATSRRRLSSYWHDAAVAAQLV